MPAADSIRKTPVLVIILASYTMIVLDISIVITALPQIHEDLGFSATALSWVQNAYLLAFGGLLLLGARAGDLVGRRRIFVIGLGVFTLASVAVGAAQSEAWLITARAMQGVGAAILAPSTLALLQTSFEAGAERTRAVSYYAAVAGVAATVGLVAGGIFAGLLSWRVGFFINLPIGVAMMLAAPRYLPETQPRSGDADAVGGATLTAGGIAGVSPEDAGAAGGVTNVAHQIGGSLGLAVLVAVFAAADSSGLAGSALLAHRIGAALTAAAVLLALALLISLAVRPRRLAEVTPAATRPTRSPLTELRG